MRDEIVVGDRGPGGNDLGTGDDQARAGFLLDLHEHIADLVRREVPVHRRVDDCVVPVQDLLLRFLVPALGVLLERIVEVRVAAQGAQERGLVIR
ncbi:hypothetical protein D9M72_511720 [compost metagenome]